MDGVFLISGDALRTQTTEVRGESRDWYKHAAFVAKGIMTESAKKYYGLGIKAVIIVVVVVIGIIAYAQLRPTTSTPKVTTALTTTSSSSVLPNSISQTSVGQSSPSDFQITNDKGCVYTEPSGRIDARYDLTITNRLNESFQLAGGTITAVVALQNSSRISVPAIQVPASSASAPTITIPINLAVAGTGFENGKAISVALSGWVRVQGVGEPIPVSLQVAIPSAMANC